VVSFDRLWGLPTGVHVRRDGFGNDDVLDGHCVLLPPRLYLLRRQWAELSTLMGFFRPTRTCPFSDPPASADQIVQAMGGCSSVFFGGEGVIRCFFIVSPCGGQ
jgi:hypothetical protein